MRGHGKYRRAYNALVERLERDGFTENYMVWGKDFAVSCATGTAGIGTAGTAASGLLVTVRRQYDLSIIVEIPTMTCNPARDAVRIPIDTANGGSADCGSADGGVLYGRVNDAIEFLLDKVARTAAAVEQLTADYPFVSRSPYQSCPQWFQFRRYWLPVLKRIGGGMVPFIVFGFAGIRAFYDFNTPGRKVGIHCGPEIFRRFLADMMSGIRAHLEKDGDLLAWDLYILENPWVEELMEEGK